MATLQIRIDDGLKERADILFSGLGLDTSTAVRIFINAALESDGIPFPVKHNKASNELLEAIEDTRHRRNLSKPYKTAEEAVKAMVED